MRCDKCYSPMVEKALFTSTYWECEPCENPQPERSPSFSYTEEEMQSVIDKYLPFGY